ncbi:MAG: FHA domain-containing protein [Polyangiales bacterium]
MSTTTLRDTPATLGDAPGDAPQWTLQVIHHPTRALVGLRRVLLPDTAVALGRDGEALGPGGLDDARLSRRHARVAARPDGTLAVDDLGSSNGTWVNERPATQRALEPDDVLRVGGIVLLVQRAPAAYTPDPRGAVPALSWPMARTLRALAHLAPRRPVVAWAEPGAGADALARWLHEREAPGAPFAHIADVAAPRAVAPDATVLLGPVRSLNDPAVADALAALTSSARRVVLWREAAPGEQEAYELDAHPALAAMGALALRVPPLRERVADLPELVDRASRRHFGAPASLHHRLAAAMALAPWPGNLAELDAFALAHLRPGDRPTDLHDAMPLGQRIPAEGAAEPRALLRVAADGTWFARDDGARVAVHPRRTLVRVLRALAEHHRAGVQEALSTAEIVEAAWPGERLVGDSGPTRAYVALSSLRRIGLRDAIARDGEGYRLGGDEVTVEVV